MSEAFNRIQEKLADDQVDSGRIPRTAECEVKDDLVDLVGPGDVVCVSGIVKILSVEEGNAQIDIHKPQNDDKMVWYES